MKYFNTHTTALLETVPLDQIYCYFSFFDTERDALEAAVRNHLYI